MLNKTTEKVDRNLAQIRVSRNRWQRCEFEGRIPEAEQNENFKNRLLETSSFLGSETLRMQY